MTLTNPTDDELHATFAEKVAGLDVRHGQFYHYNPLLGWLRTGGIGMGVIYPDEGAGSGFRRLDGYCDSADLVLPWLEKQPHPEIGRVANGDWKVTLHLNVDSGGQEREVNGIDKSLPRAAVIVLLRAHGVEVIFT